MRAEMPGRRSGFREEPRRENIRHRRHERGRVLQEAGNPRAHLCDLIKEATELRSQKTGAAHRARTGRALRRRRSRFREKPRREDIRQCRHERSGALQEAGDDLRASLCNLVKEAAQLWSQEARAAHCVRGGGHSRPSLVRSSSRSRSCSSSSAWSWRAVSRSRK